MLSRTVVAAATAATLQFALQAPAPALGTPTAGAPPDAPVWGPVKVLAANPWAEDLAVDARGVTTVVWSTGGSDGSVVAARRTAHGRWRAPVVVGQGQDPQVAADRRGNVTVAWLTGAAGRTDGVAVARHANGGRWSHPVVLTPRPARRHRAVDVGLSVAGNGATVAAWAWRSSPGHRWRIQAAVRPARGAWSGPVAVTPASGARMPLVGRSDRGGTVIVYARQRQGHPQALFSRDLTPRGTWSPRSLVAREGYSPQLAVDRAGDAVVAYTPDFEDVTAAYRTVSGHWRRHDLVPTGVEVSDFALAASLRGDAVVALGRNSGRVDVVERSAAGSWSAPDRVVRSRASVYDVVVALDGARDLFLGWGGYALFGKYRPHGGVWGDRATVSPDAGAEVLESTAVAMAPDGTVVLLWKQEERPLKVRVLAPADAGPR